MKNENNNKYFWAFIYLITNFKEDYLNKCGKIIYDLVLSEGKIKSFKCLSKKLNVCCQTSSNICKKINDEHIVILKNGNKKELTFSDSILREAEKLINNLK